MPNSTGMVLNIPLLITKVQPEKMHWCGKIHCGFEIALQVVLIGLTDLGQIEKVEIPIHSCITVFSEFPTF